MDFAEYISKCKTFTCAQLSDVWRQKMKICNEGRGIYRFLNERLHDHIYLLTLKTLLEALIQHPAHDRLYIAILWLPRACVY